MKSIIRNGFETWKLREKGNPLKSSQKTLFNQTPNIFKFPTKSTSKATHFHLNLCSQPCPAVKKVITSPFTLPGISWWWKKTISGANDSEASRLTAAFSVALFSSKVLHHSISFNKQRQLLKMFSNRLNYSQWAFVFTSCYSNESQTLNLIPQIFYFPKDTSFPQPQSEHVKVYAKVLRLRVFLDKNFFLPSMNPLNVEITRGSWDFWIIWCLFVVHAM